MSDGLTIFVSIVGFFCVLWTIAYVVIRKRKREEMSRFMAFLITFKPGAPIRSSKKIWDSGQSIDFSTGMIHFEGNQCFVFSEEAAFNEVERLLAARYPQFVKEPPVLFL